MSQLLIKICGVQDTASATAIAKLGVNFIGIIFHPHSRRYVSPSQAKKIATASLEAGATPVAVFVNHRANEMETICLSTGITTVQLHGTIARNEHSKLPDTWQRIYVHPVAENGHWIRQKQNSCWQCDSNRDFLLFDHQKSGQGHCFQWENFHYQGPFRWFVAGGLTAQNIDQALHHLHPTGIDVASGVESKEGKKVLNLVRQLIHVTR